MGQDALSRPAAFSAHSRLELAGPPAQVWAILIHFAAYPDWNPLIRRVWGHPRAGGWLAMLVRLPGWPMPLPVAARVVEVLPQRRLRWRGGLPGLLMGDHTFTLEPLAGGGLALCQREDYSGWAAPLFGWLALKAGRGFAAMDEALKQRAGCGPA